jgi:hypothetical protein
VPADIKVNITEDLIARATQRDSRHCMIAEAIKAEHPHFRNITVDLATIRWTNPRTQKRYICLTPNEGRNALVKFDQGAPVEPFSMSVKAIQVTPAAVKAPDGKTRHRRGRARVKPDGTIEGGKALPMGHLAGGVQSSTNAEGNAQRRNQPEATGDEGNVKLSSGKWRQYGLQQLRA